MNDRRLYLSRDKLIGGVAGGIAEYFGIDPTIVRLLFVLGVWLNGITILLYFVGMFVIPERPHDHTVYPGEEHSGIDNMRRTVRSLTEGNNSKNLGFLLIGVGVVLLLRLVIPLDWSIILPILLILVGGALLVRGFGDRL